MIKKIILGIFSVLLLLILFHQFYIPINTIDCTTQFGPCPEEISGQLRVLSGKRLGAIGREIKIIADNSETVIAEKRVYKFPAKLIVYLELKKGDVAVRINNQEKLVILDYRGEKIGLADDSQLPTLEVTTFEPDWDEIGFASEILSNIYYWNGVKRGSVDGDKLVIDQDGKSIYFPLTGDLDYHLGAYKLLLSWLNSDQGITKIKSESTGKMVLDLRYNNPVISYE